MGEGEFCCGEGEWEGCGVSLGGYFDECRGGLGDVVPAVLFMVLSEIGGGTA